MINTSNPFVNEAQLCSAPGQRQPEVPLHLGHLDEDIAELERLVALLENRLSPILTPPPPETAQSKDGVEPCTQLGDVLNAYHRRLLAAVHHLDSMSFRCEL